MWLQPEKRALRTAAFSGAVMVAAAAMLIILLCVQGGKEKSPVLAGRDGWTVVRGAPAPAGKETRVSRGTMLRGTLLLVSPAHPLPEDFPAPNTRALRAMVGSYLPAQEDVALRQEAVYALCALQLEHPLQAANLLRGTLSSAQQEDWRREAFGRFSAVFPLAEALDRALAAVPGAGESEHQTGYALDIALTGVLDLGKADPLERNETGRWLKNNLWRFGWIRRYGPNETAEGACEGLHIRYVDKTHAAAMHALDLGLEAYLSLLRREGALTLIREGEEYAYLYCSPWREDWSIRLPEGAAYTVSLDNTGWVIAAVAAQEAF